MFKSGKIMHKNPLNGRIYIVVIIFLAILIQCNASNLVNEEIVEPTVLPVELVTPKALNGSSSLDFQQNLINIQQQRTFIDRNLRKNGAKRRRIHSVSRSVNNSFRSQLATGVDGTRRMVDSGETSSSIGVNKYERTMLTNEGIERAIILVPSTIDHPKVLTAETFGSGKNTKKFNEAKTRKRQRIVKRVDGETSGGIGIRGNEYSSLGGKSAVTEQIEGLNASKTTKQQQMPIPINTTSVEIDILSNDLHLSSSMAARLRRFNKANLLKWPKSGRGNALVEYIHKVGLLGHNEHFNEKPQISFAIDDDRLNIQKEELQRIFPTENGPIQIRFGQNGNAKLSGLPVNLRTKFPKNRETQRPIRLGKADDSDMDLLSPSSHSPISDGPFKPLQQHFPNHRQQFVAAAPNLSPPSPKHHFGHHPSYIPPISPSISIPPQILQTTPRPPPQSIYSLVNSTNANAIIGRSSSLPLAQTTTTNSLSPNAKLELCCRRQNLPQTCQQFCNFDTFTQEKLLVALLGTQCPANQLGKAFDCAHSKVDHSECCQRHGIHLINGGQCMVFCRTHIKTPPNVLGYVSCLSQFGTIKNCYRDHQLKYRNLFGD